MTTMARFGDGGGIAVKQTAPRILDIGEGPQARDRENTALDAEIIALDATAEEIFGIEDGHDCELGRLQVEVASLKAELTHWRTAAQHWQAEATRLRDALAGTKRRAESSTLLLTDDAMGRD
jgi:hypothetical protein